MKKKTAVIATEDDLLVDLTFHNVSASLLTEFAEKIARPYYAGNMNAAIQNLIRKALAEQELARMRVPKMVKNGFNSVLQTSPGSRRLVAARNSGTNAKSKTGLKS